MHAFECSKSLRKEPPQCKHNTIDHSPVNKFRYKTKYRLFLYYSQRSYNNVHT